MKLFTSADNLETAKVLVTAKYIGKDLEVSTLNQADIHKPDFLSKFPCGQTPALETPDMLLFKGNAIARLIAKNTPLCGATTKDSALIDQFIELSASDIATATDFWILPIKRVIPNNPSATAKARKDIRMILKFLNVHLATRTFLVGERVTLADISVAISLVPLYTMVMDKGFRKEFVNTNRWFLTCVNQPIFKSVLGEITLCEKAQVAPEPEKQAPKVAPKKTEAPKKEEKPSELQEETPAPPKKPNPLDLLPPSKMDMDTWKRTYSNEETREVALPWLWEHLDDGYSLYWCKYKYEVDSDQLFIVCNSVGGFLQRLDKLRKYGFGSMCIFNDSKPFEIEGAWIFRGPEIPEEMKDCVDYELYEWKRVDLSNPAEKALFADFLAWDGELNGKKFNQGKIFK